MDIAVHLDNAVKADDDSTALRLVDGDFELVARNHRLHELETVNLQKNVQVLFEVFGRLLDNERAELGAGFANEDARHNRGAREVAHEVRFVYRDILDARCRFVRNKFRDLFDHLERRTLGNLFADLVNVHHRERPPSKTITWPVT